MDAQDWERWNVVSSVTLVGLQRMDGWTHKTERGGVWCGV